MEVIPIAERCPGVERHSSLVRNQHPISSTSSAVERLPWWCERGQSTASIKLDTANTLFSVLSHSCLDHACLVSIRIMTDYLRYDVCQSTV